MSKQNFVQVIDGSERCLNGHPIVQAVWDGTPWLCADGTCEYSIKNVEPKPPNTTPLNEELDKRLREIIWYELGDGLNATDVDEAVASIKRFYADEVMPKVDSLMQDMVNLHANMKHDMLRLGLTYTPPNNTTTRSKA